MFNRDADGYPSPGAPVGIVIELDGVDTRVCLVCAEMYISVLKSSYLRKEHDKWIAEQEHKNKLKTGQNYLDR